jgi:HSP20 family protein
MAISKATPAAPVRREPFGLLRQMTSELDRVFDEPFFASFRWPARAFGAGETTAWSPDIDVFDKDNCLVTRIDLPGMKKEEVKVEITDGYLAISGERKTEKEEKKENEYRCERAYGRFYRAVPLPQGAKLEDVKATFTDGVLEVAVPLPAKAQPAARRVEINAAPAAAKPAA